MNLARSIFRNRTDGFKSAGLTALAGIIFLLFDFGNGLKRASYDLPFAARRDIGVDDVVLIYLDDPSHQQLQQPHHQPWDRALHAQLVTNLMNYGARAIAFDILFTSPGPNPAADRALADAIRYAQGKVLLGAQFDKGKGAVKRLERPLPLFRNETDDNWGVVDLAHPDPDGLIRRHFHLDPAWKDTPSLAWRLAQRLGASAARLAENPPRQRWINYYGPPGALPQISYEEALAPPNAALTNLFRDKVVFVGAGARVGFTGGVQEAFPNPYSWLGAQRSPGVDLHATQYLNLQRGDWLRRLPPWTEFWLIALLGGGIGYALSLFRPWPAVGLGAATMLVVATLAFALVWTQHIWFSWAIVCAVQVPTALALAIVFRAHAVTMAPRWGETTEFTEPEGAPAHAESQPHVPDHELLRRIGSGSYGDVWLARSVMGTFRAVKAVYRKSFAQDRRFDREFAGLKKFEPISRLHEGLVDILHVGRNEAGGYFYYVMELADDAGGEREKRSEGETEKISSAPLLPFSTSSYAPLTLREELKRRGRLPPPECLQIGLALTGALDFLHKQILVHRDIKPSNIIFVGGLPKLADIGLVADMEEARTFVGTEGYIPPEGPGTRQADLYSLGMVLYEVSTGMEWRRFPELPAGVEGRPDREEFMRLHAVILKACTNSLEQRYQSAAEMQTDLLRLLSGTMPRPAR